ncbi:Single-stranded DNA-binding protein 2 [Takifugu flavidus]|uniref:Single-stranded DNA-binding protein 2 n=2 Tax=Tetraodontidae TaxID=31031 RepID=A0A5C6NX68_9TELE|nr:Single-stranded DNA-binding protein 2 [Takifugu flavidus]
MYGKGKGAVVPSDSQAREKQPELSRPAAGRSGSEQGLVEGDPGDESRAPGLQIQSSPSRERRELGPIPKAAGTLFGFPKSRCTGGGLCCSRGFGTSVAHQLVGPVSKLGCWRLGSLQKSSSFSKFKRPSLFAPFLKFRSPDSFLHPPPAPPVRARLGGLEQLLSGLRDGGDGKQAGPASRASDRTSGVLMAHAADVAGGSTPGCPAVECKEGRGAGGQGVTSDGVREDGEAPEEVLRPTAVATRRIVFDRCQPHLNRLALYVYEYLLHVGAQKSAQTFLSEIRWEKNITLGEPPGFLHSWWCVFWDLYCAAPDRRETCEHSSEAKAFHDYVSDTTLSYLHMPYPGGICKSHPKGHGPLRPSRAESAAAAPSPVMGNMPPNDAMPGGPMPPGFFQGPPGSQQSPHAQPPPHNPSNPMMGPHGQPFMSPRYPGGPRPSLRMPNQPPGGIPGSQPLLPNSLDPTRPQGHPNMGGPMRMNPPRGMAMGPQNYGGMRPPPNSMGGPMPGMNMGPGGRGPWPGPNTNSIAYSSSSPGNYVGPPGGGGPPGTPIMPSPGDSTNSSENIYTMMNPIGPGGNRPNFPMGPGPDGPMGAMGAMEPHHMNGSLGSGDMDGLPKSSPNNMGGMNNPPGTPRDDGEMGGNFLNPFQSESPSGTALEHAGTLIKTGPPGPCKMAAGLNRKSQSNRKGLLSDSGPGLPGFLSASRQ